MEEVTLKNIDPKIFFCPAESNPGFQFESPENRIPSSFYPVPPNSPSPLPFGLVRSGYGCRPSVQWSTTSSLPLGRLPKLGLMKNLAIFGDSPNGLAGLAGRHPRGVNVLYASGGAHWIEKSAFIDNLTKADAAGAYTVGANKYFLTDGDDATATGMWADFDRN